VKHYTSEFFINGFEFCGRKSGGDGGQAKTNQQSQDYAPGNNPPSEDFDEVPF